MRSQLIEQDLLSIAERSSDVSGDLLSPDFHAGANSTTQTLTQARKAFERAKHFYTTREEKLKQVTEKGDVEEIKRSNLLLEEAKGLYELKRAAVSVAIFNT